MSEPLDMDADRLRALGFNVVPYPVPEEVLAQYNLPHVVDNRAYSLGINLCPHDIEITVDILRQGLVWVVDRRDKGQSYEQIIGESPPPAS